MLSPVEFGRRIIDPNGRAHKRTIQIRVAAIPSSLSFNGIWLSYYVIPASNWSFGLLMKRKFYREI